jgi:putative FmdB family regulatory protein
MPLYPYECEKCGGHFEEIQKFADAPLTTHEGCGGNVHRMLGKPSFEFKGAGFYTNDYKKSSAAPVCSPAPSGGCAKPGCAN